MITVRFQTGVAVTYNDASFVRREESCVRLYSGDPDKGGSLVAYAPYDAIIEWSRPCAVERPGMTLEEAIEILATTGALQRLESRHVAALKKRLRAFDAKSWKWKL